MYSCRQRAQIHDFEYSSALESPHDNVYFPNDAYGGRRGRTKMFPRPGSQDKFTTRIWIDIS